MTSTQRLFLSICLSFFIFAVMWIDTFHFHVFSESLNHVMSSNLVISSESPGVYGQLLSYITLMGGELCFGLMSGILLLWLLKKKEYRAIVYCLITILVIIAVGKLAKHFIYSPRPVPFNLEVESFPSGHVMRATLWCGLYFMMDKLKYITLSVYAHWLLVLIPLAVGFSRIGLGRHWLTDVIGAYGLTIGLLLSCYCLIIQMKKR